jgi:hypothetical protein
MNTFGIAKIDQPTLREEIYFALSDVFAWGKSSSTMVLNLRGQVKRCLGMVMTLGHLTLGRVTAEGAIIESSFNYVVVKNLVKLIIRSEKKTR